MFAGSLSAIACSAKIDNNQVEITPEDIRLKLTGQGTDISKKVLENKKTIVQLKTAGYEQFTFSDYWWSMDDSRRINVASNLYGVDIEKSLKHNGNKLTIDQIDALPNKEVFFELNSLKKLKEDISNSSMLKVSKTSEDQNNSNKQFKSISLITDEKTLKTQLRVSDSEKEKFSKFVKEKVNENLTEEDVEKLQPWNSYFSYDLIKEKLDLENHNYLFIKDYTSFIIDADFVDSEKYESYTKVNKGIQLADYEINNATKSITLKFTSIHIPYDLELQKTLIAQPYVYTGPRRSTSWLVSVDKTVLSDFDFNEWKFKMVSVDDL